MGIPDRLKAVAVEPGSIEEVRSVLADAASARKSVVPAGGGCFLDVGRDIDRADILLRTAKLNREIFYEPQELVVKIEAGMTLGDLAVRLAKGGQELPWDCPWPDRQTVGGAIASGIAGPRRLGFGSPRDHVLGLTVVLADGRTIRPGGRVVKNVAGYDVSRLLVGSRGTLGVIVEATLKVKPLSEDIWVACARFTSSSMLRETLGALFDAGLFLSLLELAGSRGEYVLALGVEGLSEQVAVQKTVAGRLLKVNAAVEEYAGPAAREFVAAWARRPWEPVGPVFRVSVPRRRAWNLLDAIDEPVCGNAGNGVLRVLPGRAMREDEAKGLMDQLAAAAKPLGGWAVQERGPLSGADARPDAPPGVRELDEAIRRTFDPVGTLSA